MTWFLIKAIFIWWVLTFRRLATPYFSDTTTWAATGNQDLKLSIKLSLYWSVMVFTVMANTKIRDKVRPTPTQCQVVFGQEEQQFACWSSRSGTPGSFEAWTKNNNLDCAQLWQGGHWGGGTKRWHEAENLTLENKTLNNFNKQKIKI